MPEPKPSYQEPTAETKHPDNRLDFEGFKKLAERYGLAGTNPTERMAALRVQNKENVALFMADLNSQLIGSDGTKIHKETMEIGGKSAIAPEDRYDVFSSALSKIKNSREDINPARSR